MIIDTATPFAAVVLFRVTAILGVFAAAVMLGLRRQTAALRHLVWSVAIVGSIAVPMLSALDAFTLPVLPAREATRETPQRDPSPSPLTSAADANTTEIQPTSAQDNGAVTASPSPRVNWTTIVLLVWIAGVLSFSGRFAIGVVVIRRIAGRASPIPDDDWTTAARIAAQRLRLTPAFDIRLSDEIEMPFAFGVTRPVVVIPASASGWTRERREAVLMHELAHLSRGDLVINILSHLARALYWFHPLAWLASYRLRIEGERACDDVVLRGGALPSDYAEHLLDIVRTFGRPVPPPALAMARRSDFEGRLLSILEPRERRSISPLRATGIGALSVALVLPLAALSPTRRPAVIPPMKTAASLPAKQEAAERQAVAPATAVAALVETLTDANVEVRLAAVKSLGSLQDPRAIAVLAKALREDTDPRVREAAAWALGEIDDARAVAPLLEALRVERVAVVREKIVHALGEIDDASAMSGVAAAAKDASAPVRREVVWALGEFEDPSAAPALVTMVRDDDVEVRRHLADALGNLKHAATFDALVVLARDSDAEVRASAINALGNLEEARALSMLVAALGDANADVRGHAAEAIHNIPDLKSAPRALIDALSDANADVRHQAADALGGIGDIAAVPALKKATSDTNADVRRAAAEALSEIGGPEAITALMALLKDQDPEVRKIAAEALGKKR